MTSTYSFSGGTTFNSTVENSNNDSEGFDVMKILQLVIASLGVTTNLIVVVVFLNHKKLRRKIPNICIINQVSVIKYMSVSLPIIGNNKVKQECLSVRVPIILFMIEIQTLII